MANEPRAVGDRRRVCSIRMLCRSSFAGFERYTKKTRRAAFLEEMEQVVPWRKLCALIEPHYPKAGGGRPRDGAHAAHIFCVAVVQPVGAGAGRNKYVQTN